MDKLEPTIENINKFLALTSQSSWSSIKQIEVDLFKVKTANNTFFVCNIFMEEFWKQIENK